MSACVYVCPTCNSLVEQPRKRWWSRWRYCQNRHVLYVRWLGPTLEQSFLKSFLKGFLPSIVVFCLTVLTGGVAPDYPPSMNAHRGSVAASIGFMVAVLYSVVGLTLFRKAQVWTRRTAPVQRLVTHAKGRACGFLASIACQIAIILALLFAK